MQAEPILQEAPREPEKYKVKGLDWVKSIPFLALHVAAVVGLFFFPITWQGVLLCVVLYYVRMFGINTGYHRYFSHRSFKTNRWFQFLLALLGTLSVQKGVLWWAAHHRNHHKYSDQENDVHSPTIQGFWWSHVGWVLSRKFDKAPLELMKDFEKYPEIQWLNRHFLIPVVLYAAALYAFGGWAAFFWGFVVSTVVLWHGTFTVNSLAHLWGKRRYNTGDTSRNNLWIALITLGEGWHNNHHYYMNSARQGFFWWEIDASYYVLRMLSWARIVWDIRVPPAHVLSSQKM